nr:cytochrome P450 89A2-like [Setaria viridis]
MCLCFGDGTIGEHNLHAMRRTLHEFFHYNINARLLASSRVARLVRWRQWRYLVGTRGRLAEVFVPIIEARRRSWCSNGGHVSHERLQDLPYLHAVILESLQLHPPVPFILRDVFEAKGATVGGTAPPPDGSPVRFTFMAEDIGRDPKAWTKPEEVRPERFLAGGKGEDVICPLSGSKEIKMMPFGAGRRHCPGAGLAMIHIGCFVVALVREFE